ncbi:MAG: hypothetical protein ACTSWQ_08845 [Candidatus Thorarchaeota archaeon]
MVTKFSTGQKSVDAHELAGEIKMSFEMLVPILREITKHGVTIGRRRKSFKPVLRESSGRISIAGIENR